MERKTSKTRRPRENRSGISSRGDLLFIPEPTLTFRHDQAVEDPRDGLTLFGPLDKGKPFGLRLGVMGTASGIAYFRHWSHQIQHRLEDKGDPVARPPFPGFETIFRIPWSPEPVISLEVPEPDLLASVNLDDRHQRVHRTVGIYTDRMLDTLRTEELAVDLWFVVIPDVVYDRCRPRSTVPAALRITAERRLRPTEARALRQWPSLFREDNILAVAYQYEVNFHNQLKARLLPSRALTQVVRESTIAPPEGIAGLARPKRDVSAFQAAIAWNLCTAAFYKAGGRPWKVNGVRDGVCYLGLVFKRDDTGQDSRTACCAAQMFLDSGDGVVFRGAVGPWYVPDKDEYHLSRKAAHDLAEMAMIAFQRKAGNAPKELFIHGRVDFSEDEWSGFADAVDSGSTNLVGVTIRNEKDLKLFRGGTRPVLRGIAYVRHDRSAYLWTKGFAPRLKTYVGREVPRPLRIEILRGDAAMRTVLEDILALTKLNYNTCLLGDGMPVTLRFANAVGEILTAGPVSQMSPLPFKHYI